MPIESVKLHDAIRLLGGETKAGVNNNPLWPEALAEMNASYAETSIDGAFEFQDVPGGYYYLFAIYQNEMSLAEWMTPLKVDQPTVTCNLFNEKAERILNH